jgi:hypothetical protein
MNTQPTSDQFFSVFENYNHSIFPVQIILFLLTICALLLIGSKIKQKDKIVAGFLALLWLWMGIGYHILFYSGINNFAFGYSLLFIFQGLFLSWEGVLLYNLKFVFRNTVQALVGYIFILYGLIIFPLAGYLFEPNLSRTISVGLPSPTIILTFGFLLLCDKKFSKYLLIIPSLWAVIGISTAFKLGLYQDFMLILATIIADVMLLRNRNEAEEEPGKVEGEG